MSFAPKKDEQKKEELSTKQELQAELEEDSPSEQSEFSVIFRPYNPKLGRYGPPVYGIDVETIEPQDSNVSLR